MTAMGCGVVAVRMRVKTRRMRRRLRVRSASLLDFPLALRRARYSRAGGVDAGLGDGDDVDGVVELAVAGAVEPVALLFARGGIQRGDAGVERELGRRYESG